MKRMMKNGKKMNGRRIAAAAVAGLSAAAVAMTAVLSGAIEAEAADTLLGIEKLRSRYKQSGSEFVILEVVPDRQAAEIGYLVGGYEPVLCEWNEEEMVWERWQNTLGSLPATRRKDFIEGKKEELREYYAKQGLTENFPVEPVEAEYEEGEPGQAGFEKIVSDGDKKTGWFQKVSGSTAAGTDRYQVVFNYNGLYNGSYEFYEDVLYYNVLSATKIDSDLAGGIEDDRPIYTKKGEGIYEYCGTWGEINGAVIDSFSYDMPEEEDGEEDDSDEDDDKGGSEEDADDGDNGGSEEDSDDGDNGSDEDGEDSDKGGSEEDGDADDSDNSGDEDGDDSDNGGSEEDGDGGDSDNGGSEEDGDDSGNGDSGDSSSGGSGGKADDSNTGGGSDSSSDAADKTASASVGLQRDVWKRLVADGDLSQDDSTSADTEKSTESEDPADTEESEEPEESVDTEISTDPADSEDDPDEDQDDLDEDQDTEQPDEDEPAADDPVDGKDAVTNAVAQGDGEYYLVAFRKVSDNTEPATNTPMYSVGKNIVLSEDGEYEFIEWDGEDTSQGRQEYTFAGREIWCKNTFKSNEWFKKYVLNMDEKDYDDFRIKVLTFTPQELNGMEQIPNFNFLYLNSGLREEKSDKDDVSGNSTVVSGNSTDDGNDDEVRASFVDTVKAGLFAVDSLPGKWRELVADGSASESTVSPGSGSGDGSGTGSADDTENDGDESGSGNAGDTENGGDGSGSESADDTENNGDGSGTGSADDPKDDGDESGSGNAGDTENGGDGSGTGSGSENADDTENDEGESGSENADDTENDEDESGTEDGSENDGGGEESVSENSAGVKKNAGTVSKSARDNDAGDTEALPYSADNDLSDELLKYFFEKTVAGAMPCLVDGCILYAKDESGAIAVREELKNTNIFRLSAILCQDNLSEWYEDHRSNYARLTVDQLLNGIVEDADKNFVEEQVYCRFGNGSDSIINDQFYTATIYKEGSEIEPGFQCVLDEIKLDNLYRESDTSGNYKPLSTNISQAKAVRHILNYADRRKVTTKTEIKVLEIQPAMADEPEMTLEQIQKWAPDVKKADITVMTTAEFIGKIEKLNETYDLIYIGTSKDHLNMRYWTDSSYIGKPDEDHVAAGTAFNDVDMDGLIYYNIGDLRVVTLPMAGLLTTEYRNGNRGDWTYFYNYVRYGGNDISKEKMNALMSFLDGSYPVIIADDFLEQPVTVYADAEYKGARVNLTEGEYTKKQLTELGVKELDISSIKVKEGYRLTVFDEDGFKGNSDVFTQEVSDLAGQAVRAGNWDNRIVSLIVEREENAVPDRAIDEDHIDNCTYLYEFVTKAMKNKYLNFYAKGDIEENSELFKFYLNRPKVSLTGTAVNGLTEDGSDIYYIESDINGKYDLQYRFTIQNEGTASYNTRYDCKLYIDVNSDGKFSDTEEIEDISLTQGGSTVSSDNLYADREYVLTRQVPTGYKGLLPWRVEITQADNPNIYTSMSGYTKLKGMDKEVLKICQINKNGSDVIDLNYEVNTKGRYFNTLVYGGDYDGVRYPGIADEFELEITTMDVDTFQSRYYANNEYLKDFNMLILGFSDMYGDFAGDAESGPMGAIVDFINSGKSVLLGHDTTSFFNSPDLGQGDQAMKGYPWRNNTQLHDIWWYNESQGWWYTRNASTLNKYVRPLVGMDRYGILDSEILQRGNVLQKGTGDYEAVVDSGKDVAYKPKSGKKETVPEVHGYTYSLISAKDQKVMLDTGTTTKYQYTKWNLLSNNYNNYPEIVFENKYTNIRFDPAWFWESSDGVESDPARYGELEKVNNGEVWNVHATQVNQGQITEYPYKLKEEFEVALTHAQYYELDYTADDDGDGQSDLVVWYCLGGRTSPTGHSDWEDTIYSQSPNDVRNNYYIYNKGNITYTGMGHARKNWNEEWYTFEEAKLFINTMIASYQAGIKDPLISVLKSGVPEAESMKLLYRYYDKSNDFSLNDEITADGYEKIYFTVQDINFIKGTRKIESHVYYQDDGGGEVINVDGTDITVNRLPDSIYDATDGSAVDAANLTSGGIYYIQVPKTIMKRCEDGLDLYFEAQSTITTNTTKANVYVTEKVYAKLQVLQAYLFDLE